MRRLALTLVSLALLIPQPLKAEDGDKLAQDRARLANSLDRGDPDTNHVVGLINYSGKEEYGIPKDYSKALYHFRQAASKGYAPSECQLGVMYQLGNGVNKDEKVAVSWYMKAAEHGDHNAMTFLANCYLDGTGVSVDEREALKWHTLASSKGSSRSNYFLWVMHSQGRGVPQNDKEAVRWLRLAAEQGHHLAQAHLGRSYLLGTGVHQDYVQAYAWMSVAVANGMTQATETREDIAKHLTPTQREKGQRLAVEWFKKYQPKDKG